MRTKPLPSLDAINSRLLFDPETGTLKWRRQGRNHQKEGRLVCGVSPSGYLRIRINRELFFAHRIIWKMVHGSDPDGVVDHIDGNPSNNRPCNLRVGTQTQNARNARSHKDHSSIFKGVSWHKTLKKWRVRIMVNRKEIALGCYDTEEEARSAYIEGAKKYHSEFANNGDAPIL